MCVHTHSCAGYMCRRIHMHGCTAHKWRSGDKLRCHSLFVWDGSLTGLALHHIWQTDWPADFQDLSLSAFLLFSRVLGMPPHPASTSIRDSQT